MFCSPMKWKNFTASVLNHSVDLEQMFVCPWTKFIAFLMYLLDERRNSNFFGGHYPGQDTAINNLKAHSEVLRLRSVFAKYPARIHTFQQSDQLLKNISWKLNKFFFSLKLLFFAGRHRIYLQMTVNVDYAD